MEQEVIRIIAGLYDTALGATAAMLRLRDARDRGLVTIDGQLAVTWVRGTHAPHAKARLRRRAEGSVLHGLADLMGVSVHDGAETAQSWSLTPAVDPGALARMRDHLVPGHSQLLVVADETSAAQVRELLGQGSAPGHMVLLEVGPVARAGESSS